MKNPSQASGTPGKIGRKVPKSPIANKANTARTKSISPTIFYIINKNCYNYQTLIMAKEKEPKQPQKTAKKYDHGDVVLRFDKVTFGYSAAKPLLEVVDFSVRERAKITLMGQNGAGKSTIFELISGSLKPEEGAIHIKD